MKYLRILSALVVLIASSWLDTAAQLTNIKVKGVVLDSITREPVPFANAFFANTTIGTTTNDKGEFSLNYPKAISAELVFSQLSFDLKKLWIDAKYKDSLLIILMHPKATNIKEVNIIGKKNPSRQYYLRIFNQYFLGDAGKLNCVLENPGVLEFRKEGSRIYASASTPLIIRNTHLGYYLKYYLDYFVFNDISDFDETRDNQSWYGFQGSALYSKMNSRVQEEQQQWSDSRTEAYQGSFGHFLSCLYMDSLPANSYLVLRAGIPDSLPKEILTDSVFYYDEAKLAQKYLHYAMWKNLRLFNRTKLEEVSQKRSLRFADSLLVFRDTRKTPLELYDDEVTLFHLGKGLLEFNSQGTYQVYNSDLIWGALDSKKRIINLLPLDY
jgi:hypothetical protein